MCTYVLNIGDLCMEKCDGSACDQDPYALM